jgi:hypothetical protein
MSRATGRLRLEPRSALEIRLLRRTREVEMAVRTDETRTTRTAQIDEARLHAFPGRAVGDVRVFEVRR